MPNELSTDLSQTEENNLSRIAETERAKLFPKNDFAPGVDEYSVTNPDALADGDSMGRGTGVFLDIFNNAAGTREDIIERRDNIRVNPYNQSRPYPQF